MLKKVDDIIRMGIDVEKALDLVDQEILIGHLEVSPDECGTARGIWKKMQQRRLKRG